MLRPVVHQPLVSIVIPVLDDAEMLRRCLTALATQTVRPGEIIVVDNGCSDDSAEIARRAGARVIEEPIRGIPAASAAGYDAARFDIIGRLDADSVPPANWVERVLEDFVEHPEIAAVTGGGTFVDGPRWMRDIGPMFYLAPYFIWAGAAFGHVPLFGSNCAMRRSVWQEIRNEVHRTDSFVHDDMDLTMHIGPRRRVRFDRHLHMGVSARPVMRGGRDFARRFHRGVYSLTIHWPDQTPMRRIMRRAWSRELQRKP
jgi:glycosyltransferase involved in cell wall biosynthesis